MTAIIEKVQNILEPLLADTDIFLVSIKVKPVNNIKVYLDADSGFSIEKCISINRKLYAQMEGSEMFPDGDYSLEVSSPGIEEPLIQHRQYIKNTGRTVTVTDNEGVEKTGIMKELTETGVVLEIKPAKPKLPVIIAEIPFANIKKTVVQIIF